MFGNRDRRHPGELLGVYAIAAVIDPGSTCSTLLSSTPTPWNFQVELRREQGTAYWVQNDVPIAGTLGADGAIGFQVTQSYPIDAASTTPTRTSSTANQDRWPDPLAEEQARKDAGAARCVILRTDHFRGQLDGVPDAGTSTLRGTLQFSYVAAAGSDCSAVLGSPTPDHPNAVWGELPCQAQFAVVGHLAN